MRKAEFFKIKHRTSNFTAAVNALHYPWNEQDLLTLVVRLCKRALFSGTESICEFLRAMLNHNQILLSMIVSCSFHLFGEFSEVLNFERKM